MKRFEQLLKYIGGPLFIFSIYNIISGVLAQGLEAEIDKKC